jgi:hypothetical protein
MLTTAGYTSNPATTIRQTADERPVPWHRARAFAALTDPDAAPHLGKALIGFTQLTFR